MLLLICIFVIVVFYICIYECMCMYVCVYMYVCIYIYICMCVCMYVCIYIYIYIYLYLSVFYILLLVLSVRTKGLRVTQFNSLYVCMCCTCGRIDIKLTLTEMLSFMILYFT